MEKHENRKLSLEHNEFLVSANGTDGTRVQFDGQGIARVGDGMLRYEVISGQIADGSIVLLIENEVFRVAADDLLPGGDTTDVTMTVNEVEWSGRVDDRRSLLARKFGKGRPRSSAKTDFRAPMPGLVTKILVREGDRVEKGQGLLILEAMKMENELKAEDHGSILSIQCSEKKPVDKGQHLLSIHYDH